MNLRHFLAGTAAVMAFGMASPALAQPASVDEDGNGSADNNTVIDDTANDFLDLLSNNLNGNNRDNENNGASQGSNSASRGGSIASGNFITATQTLAAINVNQQLDEVVDLDGEDDTDTAVGYNSGNNRVSDNAFAAFAGILNQAFNTGINANTQAATNIAAQGTVNFGTDSGAGGGGGGDDD